MGEMVDMQFVIENVYPAALDEYRRERAHSRWGLRIQDRCFPPDNVPAAEMRAHPETPRFDNRPSRADDWLRPSRSRLVATYGYRPRMV